MNHHTHHGNIVAPHHVQVEVHSKYSVKWVEITWKTLVRREMSLKPQYSEMLNQQAWERRECTLPCVVHALAHHHVWWFLSEWKLSYTAINKLQN
jgi:hypothetical protein